MTPEERLADLGLEVPDVVPPAAVYVPAMRTGNHIYTAGQLPMRDGKLLYEGVVGSDVTPEQAYECAAQCALNAIAAVRSATGSLSEITRIVKVVGFVASSPDFIAQSQVVNGASELLGKAFGAIGQHARSAVGVLQLPLGAPVEVEMIVEVSS